MKDHIVDMLINQARGFYDLGFNCAYNIEKNNRKLTSFQRLGAGAVNMAFCAELLLKGTHLVVNNKSVKGHKLRDLFLELPKLGQSTIEDIYIEMKKSDTEQKYFGHYKINLYHPDAESDKSLHPHNTLLEFLQTHNATFENWRYLHEVNGDGYTYIIDFRSMHCFIQALFKYLANEISSKD